MVYKEIVHKNGDAYCGLKNMAPRSYELSGNINESIFGTDRHLVVNILWWAPSR